MRGSTAEMDALKGAAKDLLQVESTLRELMRANETLQEQADSLKKENTSLRSTLDSLLATKQQATNAELKMTKNLVDNMQLGATVESLHGELKQEQQQSLNLRREISLLRGEVNHLSMMKDKK